MNDNTMPSSGGERGNGEEKLGVLVYPVEWAVIVSIESVEILIEAKQVPGATGSAVIRIHTIIIKHQGAGRRMSRALC